MLDLDETEIPDDLNEGEYFDEYDENFENFEMQEIDRMTFSCISKFFRKL